MKIEKVLEVLNQAICDRDLSIWCRDEEIKKQAAEIASLKERIAELEAKKDW